MSLSVYQVTVPVYIHLLGGLSSSLDKAVAYAAEKKIDPAVLLTARLYPDMWSLMQQVNAACSHAVRGTARLAEMPIPTFAGKDSSFEELTARIAWTIEHLKGLTEAALAGAAERTIVFPSGDSERRMTGADYLLSFSLPNFYFHLTTAYDILRHNGVTLVKDNFTGE
jgi:hypothetical protein